MLRSSALVLKTLASFALRDVPTSVAFDGLAK